MDTLTSMRVFKAVAALGSFSGAAGQLDMSPAMATKHVAHLESHLGARLLHRTTRKVSLTEIGRQYLAQCLDGLDLIDAAEASVSQGQDRPSGILKITAPVWLANAMTAQMLARYRETYPGVVLDIQLENRRVDLVADGYDLALRATAEPSPSLIVRALCPVPFYLVAAHDFFPPGGAPRDVQAAQQHGTVMPSYVSLENVTLETPSGRVRMQPKPVMYCSDTNLALQCVLAKIGMAFLPAWLVDDHLAQGRLIHVLPDHTFAPVMLYAAYSSRRYMTSKVRTFIDFMHTALNKA